MTFRKRIVLWFVLYLLALATLFGPTVHMLFGANDRLGDLPLQPEIDRESRIGRVRAIVRNTVQINTMAYTVHQGMVQSVGTGVVIGSEGIILTAAHVVRNAQFIMIAFRRLDSDALGFDLLRQEPADVIAIHPTYDIALIKMRYPQHTVLIPMGIELVSDYSPGTRLWFIGMHEAPSTLVVQKNRIDLPIHQHDPLTKPVVHRDVLSARGKARRGDSGGPVFDEHGRIVGIVIAANTPAEQVIVLPMSVAFLELIVQAVTRAP